MGGAGKQTREVFAPVDQDTVPFYGRELVAVQLADGRICAVLRWLCEGLNLDPQGQLQRIQRKAALADGLLDVRVDTPGGPQTMPALTLDVLPGYLFTIDEHRVKPEARDDVVLFQRECVHVLAGHFARKGRLTLSTAAALVLSDLQTAAQVAQLVEQIDTLGGAVTLMREHLAALLALPGQVAAISAQLGQAVALLETLAERQGAAEHQLAAGDERTARLTPAHAQAVQEMVDRMVRETARLPVPLTYAAVYGRLKHRFRVGSYGEVADGRLDELMDYLRDELGRATCGEAPEQGSLF